MPHQLLLVCNATEVAVLPEENAPASPVHLLVPIQLLRTRISMTFLSKSFILFFLLTIAGNNLQAQGEDSITEKKVKLLFVSSTALGKWTESNTLNDGTYKERPLIFQEFAFQLAFPLGNNGLELGTGLGVNAMFQDVQHDFLGIYPDGQTEFLKTRIKFTTIGLTVPLFMGWESAHNTWKYYAQGGFSLLYAFYAFESSKVEGETFYSHQQDGSKLPEPIGGIVPQLALGTRYYRNGWFLQLAAFSSVRITTNFSGRESSKSLFGGLQVGLGF